MIHASFVELPRARNSRETNAWTKAGQVPPEFAQKTKRAAHKDCDARWTKKHHETFHGYKDHVKVDVADKILLAGMSTAANVHDRQQIAGLVREGDRVVDAESASLSATITADLAGKNPGAQICGKATRAAPLTEAQKRSNRRRVFSRRRARRSSASERPPAARTPALPSCAPCEVCLQR